VLSSFSKHFVLKPLLVRHQATVIAMVVAENLDYFGIVSRGAAQPSTAAEIRL